MLTAHTNTTTLPSMVSDPLLWYKAATALLPAPSSVLFPAPLHRYLAYFYKADLFILAVFSYLAGKPWLCTAYTATASGDFVAQQSRIHALI
jgi:hypothetical protein